MNGTGNLVFMPFPLGRIGIKAVIVLLYSLITLSTSENCCIVESVSLAEEVYFFCSHDEVYF